MSHRDMRLSIRSLVIVALAATSAPGQLPRVVSAPVTGIQYEVTADSGAVAARTLAVTMTFQVSSTEPVILALPAWSPGHYTLLWFAGRVSRFRAESDGRPLEWRKRDFQTWSIRPRAAGAVRVSFDYAADAVDRAVAWTSPNFAFFNGTNLFLYPVGRGFDWPARVAVRTERDWRVTTGMDPAGAPNVFSATNYHDLVDMPFYVGRFDLDSAQAADRWIRFALYPAGAMTAARRDRTLGWLQKLVPAQAAIFGDVPFRNYTVFVRSDTVVNFGGLEHQSSQIDEVTSSVLDGNLSGLFSHELFHAWNVKRLRPADLVPYRYDDAQPTPWLWVSEGVTDYYGTIALSRAGISDSTAAFDQVASWIANIDGVPATAVSDASLSAWIGSRDGSGGLYYPKGALTGFLLDVLIRDASNNRHSLDDVMRQLYDSTYKRGRGFTSDDWWSAVARNAGTSGAKATFLAFASRYVEGREPLPVDSVLSLAALRVERTTIREPRFGVTTRTDSSGVEVTSIVPGGAASMSGLRVGDRLVTIGDVKITDLPSFDDVRARYAGTALPTLPGVIRRGTEALTLQLPVRLVERAELHVVPLMSASPRAIAIRHAIFLGSSRGPGGA
ncbi:MAG TPA: PDZ domain-containing protein [Gemmatimonadaceae bacterium]|nr:PDZ domain-containing protein [Gemmatimonadaceae bacterium]